MISPTVPDPTTPEPDQRRDSITLMRRGSTEGPPASAAASPPNGANTSARTGPVDTPLGSPRMSPSTSPTNSPTTNVPNVARPRTGHRLRLRTGGRALMPPKSALSDTTPGE